MSLACLNVHQSQNAQIPMVVIHVPGYLIITMISPVSLLQSAPETKGICCFKNHKLHSF